MAFHFKEHDVDQQALLQQVGSRDTCALMRKVQPVGVRIGRTGGGDRHHVRIDRHVVITLDSYQPKQPYKRNQCDA